MAEHEVQFGVLTLKADGSVEVREQRTIRQSAFLACPHVIIDPQHYREDETCRCDDAEEQHRLIREFGYSVSDFPEPRLP